MSTSTENVDSKLLSMMRDVESKLRDAQVNTHVGRNTEFELEDGSRMSVSLSATLVFVPPKDLDSFASAELDPGDLEDGSADG